MDKRYVFRTAADTTVGPKKSKRTGRRTWRLFSLVGLLIWMCVILVALNFWLVHITGPQATDENPDKASSWSHLIFYAAGNKQSKNTKPTVSSKVKGVPDTCEVPRFDPKSKHPDDVTCKRRKPLEGSCELAKKLYLSEPKPKCEDERSVKICQLERKANAMQVKCAKDICKHDIDFGLIGPVSGMLTWKTVSSAATVEATILDLLKTNSSGGNYGFCFLRCTLANAKKEDKPASQLLLLPQYFTKHTCNDKICQDAININVIWLDSVSHSHFYRSLPQSVSALREATKNKHAHVFNYNLMQSMIGGTYVNAVAFTKGKASNGIGNLLKLFQNGGYHVTYMDDLCWLAMLTNRIMGIPKLFGMKSVSNVTKSWQEMHKMMDVKGVDQIGIALANCETMPGEKNIFLERTKDPKCYNGVYYTDYILAYLELLQTQLHEAKRPYFNYVDLNTCHEPSGRRCQTLDGSLAKLITHTGRQKNTLTFMFGDHGLKYGKSLRKSREGYVEAAHPVFFLMASKDLDAKLGDDKMSTLRANTDRLIDIIDIRQTLYTLLPVENEDSFNVESKYDTHPNGLFHPISPNRTCNALGIQLESHKCICEEGPPNQKTLNGTRVNVLAEFALGEINNIIQEQFISANKKISSSGYGLCHRLVGKWIDQVEENVKDNFTETEMLIHLPTGSNVPQMEDLFNVIVQVASNSSSGPSIKLIHYLRTSSHGSYDECRDDGVDPTLCVCSPSNQSTTMRQWHRHPQIVFGTATTVVSLNKHLFIYERRTSDGIVLEASCDDEINRSTYKLVILAEHKVNVVSSKSSPLVVTVRSGMMVFIDVFYPLDSSKKWDLEYEVSYTQLA
ncbi:uncharacterized protein [Amphiura filiformis]|uniref:uncharacterized protein n=1 Tax=Amphiura filiformis TaxID=82378 RepID=UPI003B2126E0